MRKFLTAKQFGSINDLYWDEGELQPELADMFGICQPHVSRIVRDLVRPYQCTLSEKLMRLNKNIVPVKNEHPNAITLRAKRHRLPSTKLTWRKVMEIRRSYFAGEAVQADLATKYGLNQSTISRIIAGKKWKKL